MAYGSNPRSLAWVLIAASLAVASACGDGRIKTYPVSGKVLVDGRPAAGARVVFHPIEGDEAFMRERPVDMATDADGGFELMTFEPGDGAPAGKYRVGIKWRGGGQGSMQSEDEGRRPRAGGRDRLGGRYANAQQSGLTAEVPPESEIVFELSTE